MKSVLFYVILFGLYIFSNFAFGQDDVICGKTFEEVSRKCLEKYSKKIKKTNISITKFESGDIYLYQTESGDLGKLNVISTEKIKGQCSFYFSTETYSKNGNYTRNANLTINNVLGIWETRAIDLDGIESAADFQLETSKKGNDDCFLSSLNNSGLYKLKNIPSTPDSTGSTLIYFAMLICVGVSAFIMAYTIFKDESEYSVNQKLDDADDTKNSQDYKKYGIVLRFSKPFFKRYFSPIVQGMKGVKKIRDNYKRPLANAGLSKILTPDDFFAFKIFLILGFPLIFLAVRSFLEATWPLSLTPIISLIGYVYPDLWIKSQTQKRREEIINAMPFVVDMLALSIEAGLDFIAAMARVIEKAPPSALSDEFQNVIKDIRLGSSRGEALRQLSWRVDEIVVNSFCATLIAADSVGASVGPVLKTLAGEIRQKRSSLIEQAGAKAATKILLPMILLIVPAVFIIVMGPPLMDVFR